MQRTPRGRMLTRGACVHLGLDAPAAARPARSTCSRPRRPSGRSRRRTASRSASTTRTPTPAASSTTPTTCASPSGRGPRCCASSASTTPRCGRARHPVRGAPLHGRFLKPARLDDLLEVVTVLLKLAGRGWCCGRRCCWPTSRSCSSRSSWPCCRRSCGRGGCPLRSRSACQAEGTAPRHLVAVPQRGVSLQLIRKKGTNGSAHSRNAALQHETWCNATAGRIYASWARAKRPVKSGRSGGNTPASGGK